MADARRQGRAQQQGRAQPQGYKQQQNVRLQQQPNRRPQKMARTTEPYSPPQRSSSGIGLINILNALAYIANAFVTYGVGTFGLFGLATNATVSATYPTLVTPSEWTFLIWIVIFMFQLAWAIVQLLPDFRIMPLVTAMGWNYLVVCAAQIGWTIAFGLEIIWLSLVAMVFILFFLFRIHSAQSGNEASPHEYWVLKFPFSLHYGWIIAATVLNINVLLVSLGVSDDIQFYVALASVSALMLVGCATSDLVVLLVLAWATIGIWAELGNSNNTLTSTFDYTFIMWLRRWALGCFVLIMVLFLVRAFLAGRERRRRHANDSDYKSMGEVSEITY